MEALGRFELPTCGLGNRRSIHLSYRAWDAHGLSLSLASAPDFSREDTLKAAPVNVRRS